MGKGKFGSRGEGEATAGYGPEFKAKVVLQLNTCISFLREVLATFSHVHILA